MPVGGQGGAYAEGYPLPLPLPLPLPWDWCVLVSVWLENCDMVSWLHCWGWSRTEAGWLLLLLLGWYIICWDCCIWDW